MTTLNGSCPTCRIELQLKPVPAHHIDRHLKNHITQRMQEEQRSTYLEKSSIESLQFSLLPDPWITWIEQENIIHDSDDDVDRCGRCGYELVGNMCSNCNTNYPHHTARRGEALRVRVRVIVCKVLFWRRDAGLSQIRKQSYLYLNHRI